MAFVAGVTLMYLPEEPAFRMLCRLLGEDGACLRRLYLPGLDGLKSDLRKFEWLMERHYPLLATHLIVSRETHARARIGSRAAAGIAGAALGPRELSVWEWALLPAAHLRVALLEGRTAKQPRGFCQGVLPWGWTLVQATPHDVNAVGCALHFRVSEGLPPQELLPLLLAVTI
jgi:Rab-GTPase-TBC domain